MKSRCIPLAGFIVFAMLDTAVGQTLTYLTAGRIEFEKKVNTQYLISRELARPGLLVVQKEQYEKYQATQPKFLSLQSTLFFNGNTTLFVPAAPAVAGDVLNTHPAVEQRNTVFSNFEKNQTVCKKKVFDDNFLISGQLSEIKWKITTEIREIAGFSCRRANGLILDSVYVVAFYTDMILTEGGPETFHGLPGMILGLIMPHKHVSWFATQVVPSNTIPKLTGIDKKINQVSREQWLATVGRFRNNRQISNVFGGFWEFLVL